MFENSRPRFASFGIVSALPGEIIDQVWYIIDNNLKGMFRLDEIIGFNLVDNNGRVRFDFLQGNEVVASFDTPFTVSSDYPAALWAYDDGSNQIIMLPKEPLG